MSRLKTENPSRAMGRRVEAAFRALRGGRGDAVYEHGQWWITAVDAEDGRTYSVCDASGPPSFVCDGFSFEEV